MSSKAVDAAVLAALLAVCGGIIYFFDLKLLFLAVLLFGLPAAYLLLCGRPHVVRDVPGALLLGVVFVFLVDYFGGLNRIWVYGSKWFWMPQPVAGHVLFEILVWAFLWALSIILFFGHFFDARAPRGLSRRYLPILLLSLIGIFNLLYFPLSTELFTIPYAYAWWGLCSLLPVVAALWLYPHFLSRLFCASALLVIPGILFEWAALKAGYWTFAGDYLYVFGTGPHALPVEEVVFWVLAGPLIVLCNFLLFVRAEG